FQGFAAKLPAEAVEAIKSHPEVDAIEPDTIVTLEGEQTGLPSGLWGLDVLDGTKNSRYSYPEQAGQGVDAFIIDTGITVTHSDFGGRAKWGGDFTGEGQKDGNGHGTHVAGTVGGNTYGVAKKVNLIAVKVLTSSGSGSNSGVIAGMNYVAKECQGRQRKCVANMSLGGGKSSATDNAARSMINAGVALAVAAGNSAGNACNLSPAGVAEAFTVAASDVNNKLASFSERGPCVDIIAPGVNILSAWYTGSTNTISGTSMATPHVAGALAVAYSQNDFSSPSAAFAHLVSKAKTGAISGVPSNTVNKFLQI
ncbi:peptidase S8/S53 domain-containing protein, partial [Gaertneriomyces semiglobifer]